MEEIEVTSVSSRGQVVIPQKIREKLKITEGEKFVVIGEEDTIILKKLEIPSFKGFGRLLKRTRDHAGKNRITEKDVWESIRELRKR